MVVATHAVTHVAILVATHVVGEMDVDGEMAVDAVVELDGD